MTTQQQTGGRKPASEQSYIERLSKNDSDLIGIYKDLLIDGPLHAVNGQYSLILLLLNGKIALEYGTKNIEPSGLNNKFRDYVNNVILNFDGITVPIVLKKGVLWNRKEIQEYTNGVHPLLYIANHIPSIDDLRAYEKPRIIKSDKEKIDLAFKRINTLAMNTVSQSLRTDLANRLYGLVLSLNPSMLNPIQNSTETEKPKKNKKNKKGNKS